MAIPIHIEKLDIHGDLEEERLSQFENLNEVSLPSEYRDFLLRFNGGIPHLSFFWIEDGVDGSSVHLFYGLHDGPSYSSIDTYFGAKRYGIPGGFLPIADDGVGNTILIDVSVDRSGAIYFLDHERHPFDSPDSMEGITRLAGSFIEFLELLREEPS